MEAKVTSRGRIVIPSQIRQKYDLKAGTRIVVTEDGEQIILKPVTPEYVHRLREMLKGNEGMKALAQDRSIEQNL
ncbi:MAG: AbrB/MazE/SpoVT family DNA-binding domain-containing protein [bacterium]